MDIATMEDHFELKVQRFSGHKDNIQLVQELTSNDYQQHL